MITKIPFAEISIIKITGRSVSPFYVNVTNPEIQHGYIPLITPIKGLYYGKAIVTNVNGKAYLPIINIIQTKSITSSKYLQLEDFDIIENQNNKVIPSDELRPKKIQ